MCGGYRLDVNVDAMEEHFGVQHSQLDLPWPVEVYPGTRAPVVLDRRDASGTRSRHLGALTWGLIPSWARDLSIGRKLFNARVESLAKKPSYRDAFARRRCLVPVSAFFEWSGEAGHKQKHGFASPRERCLALAGLWEVWRSPAGERLGTFTVITTAANACVIGVHPRMPLLVAKAHWEAWLAPGEEVQELTETLQEEAARLELSSTPIPSPTEPPHHEAGQGEVGPAD